MAKRPKTVKRMCQRRIQRGDMAGIGSQGIGQLDFVSDNSDALFNAYLQILSSSKPHSEVTSTTHVPALKGFRKGASLFSGFAQGGRSPSKCSV